MIDQQLLDEAGKTIINLDKSRALEIAQQAIETGLDPVELLNKGFIPGITEVGEKFGYGELFLPELIIAGELMKSVSVLLNEAIPEFSLEKGRILIATVEGDVHDIGKGLVVSLLKANGFTVYDLGRDVKNETIIEKALEFNVDIIGTSALLTTTMIAQQKLEETLKNEGLRDRFKTMVGGAPVTQRWAKRIGADAYAEDANAGVVKAKKLLGI